MTTNYNSIIRNFAIFLLALSVVAVTHVLRQAEAAQREVELKEKYLKILQGENYRTDIENVEDGVDELVETYHAEINDMFNDRIKTMVALGNSDRKEDLDKMIVLLTPPDFDRDENNQPTKRKPCEGANNQKNLSTYCLSLDAVNEYFALREAMIEARRVAKEKAGQKFETLKREGGVTGSPDTVIERRNPFGAVADIFQGDKAIQGYGEVLNRIDRELDIARQSLDQGLAVYGELQMALPLHQKYRQVIKALEAYRDEVSAIRQQIDLYPTTFLDVTTTQCT